jgi:putative transcriptional regulator
MKVAAEKAKAAEYMRAEGFAELEESLNQAIAYERGDGEGYRVTRRPLPVAPKARSKARIVKLRQNLQCSQAMMARLLNVSTKTVQAWEQGKRKPSDAALKLLAIAEKHPEALYDSD